MISSDVYPDYINLYIILTAALYTYTEVHIFTSERTSMSHHSKICQKSNDKHQMRELTYEFEKICIGFLNSPVFSDNTSMLCPLPPSHMRLTRLCTTENRVFKFTNNVKQKSVNVCLTT